jgi:hypothetical protein
MLYFLFCRAYNANQFIRATMNITLQNLVAVLRDKQKMILNLENRMTTGSIIHCDPQLDPLALQLKPMVLTF